MKGVTLPVRYFPRLIVTVSILLVAMALAACSQPTPTPTPAPTATPTASPTAAPAPAPTATPTPQSTPTPEPPVRLPNDVPGIVDTTNLGWPREVEGLNGVVSIPAKPGRIITASVGHDEVILALAPSDRLVAVGNSTKSETFSNVASLVQGKPEITRDPETIIAQSPDVIVTSPFFPAEGDQGPVEDRHPGGADGVAARFLRRASTTSCSSAISSAKRSAPWSSQPKYANGTIPSSP